MASGSYNSVIANGSAHVVKALNRLHWHFAVLESNEMWSQTCVIRFILIKSLRNVSSVRYSFNYH